MNTRTNTQNT